MSGLPQVEIGVFGGSGFYELLDNPHEYRVNTPFGAPSSPVMVGEIGGRTVAFLPRHGKDHSLPPHMINYRANVWAMKELGVSRIIGPNACGSLQKHVEPGHFVICDQFVDRTWGRKDTFYDGPITTHVSSADPYCPTMRQVAIDEGERRSESPLTRPGPWWSSKVRASRLAPSPSGSRLRAGRSST